MGNGVFCRGNPAAIRCRSPFLPRQNDPDRPPPLTPRFIMSLARLTSSLFAVCALAPAAFAQINTAQKLAPNVYFHEGDPRRGHCNNGWIVCEDSVVVIDANFPSGAEIIMPKIKE